MAYLIDGHNLIPNIPGLSLADPNDEFKLIEILQAFCRRMRTKVDVYFDNSPIGQVRRRKFGQVTAHFISAHSSADAAIINRLKRLGKNASNWIVVTSDRRIQVEAQAVRARIQSSQEFAHRLFSMSTQDIISDPGSNPKAEIKPEDIQTWLDLFSNKDG